MMEGTVGYTLTEPPRFAARLDVRYEQQRGSQERRPGFCATDMEGRHSDEHCLLPATFHVVSPLTLFLSLSLPFHSCLLMDMFQTAEISYYLIRNN